MPGHFTKRLIASRTESLSARLERHHPMLRLRLRFQSRWGLSTRLALGFESRPPGVTSPPARAPRGSPVAIVSVPGFTGSLAAEVHGGGSSCCRRRCRRVLPTTEPEQAGAETVGGFECCGASRCRHEAPGHGHPDPCASLIERAPGGLEAKSGISRHRTRPLGDIQRHAAKGPPNLRSQIPIAPSNGFHHRRANSIT